MMRWMEPFRKWGERSANAAPAMIERDIDDELAFHLERLEDELKAQGHSETSARQEARRRFGDEERVRNQCRFIAMKERIMLQKINVVATIVLLVVVMVMGVMLVKSQRESAKQAQSLSSQLEALHTALASVERQPGMPAAFVLRGMFENVGKYPLEPDMTLLKAINLGEPGVGNLYIEVHRVKDGFPTRLQGVTVNDLRRNPALDFPLQQGDVIHAMTQRQAKIIASAGNALGVVYVEGEIERPGVYNLPVGSSLTISKLIAAAGGTSLADEVRVTVRRLNRITEQQELALDALLSEVRSDPLRDIAVVADDQIIIASTE